jgi:hypothetical protein
LRNQKTVLIRYNDLDLLKTGGRSRLLTIKNSIKDVFLKSNNDVTVTLFDETNGWES